MMKIPLDLNSVLAQMLIALLHRLTPDARMEMAGRSWPANNSWLTTLEKHDSRRTPLT